MRLEQVAFNWERFGERDPLGAILTAGPPGAECWDTETFFRTGAQELARLRARCAELGLAFGGTRALDFGCGVGRLTRHLLEDFERADGVDVAASMIERAGQLNPSEDLRFLCNPSADLDLLQADAYDLVLSLITLQHMPPAYARRYIQEFFRKVRPGGTVFFQLPTRSHGRSSALLSGHSLKQRLLSRLPARWVERYRLLRTRRPRMDMFGMPQAEVEALIRSEGGELYAADEVPDAGDLLPSLRYFARRAP